MPIINERNPHILCATKTKLGEIELIGDEIDHSYRVILRYIIFQAGS